MNATTTMTRTAVVEELHRNPSSLAVESIRYYLNDRGDHVVKCYIGFAVGRSNTFRFRTVEEARAEWVRFRADLRANGYTQKLDADGNFKGTV